MARLVAWLMAGAVVVYLVLLGRVAVELVLTGEPVAMVLGLAIFVFPLIGAWVVWREMRFGVVAERMAREWPAVESDRGIPDFEPAREHVEESPGDWRAWFELGLAYDAAGDRKRARQAMRRAESLF